MRILFIECIRNRNDWIVIFGNLPDLNKLPSNLTWLSSIVQISVVPRFTPHSRGSMDACRDRITPLLEITNSHGEKGTGTPVNSGG
jgi:hypothetical protein